ncbi:hypothetical protein MMC24_004312 [Lignoscripta atroalba]|nr:hypothetical protein [Lignoscripta atroalba]
MLSAPAAVSGPTNKPRYAIESHIIKLITYRCKVPTKPTDIIYEQPRPNSPPTIGLDKLQSYSYRPSQWLVEGRSIASRVSSTTTVFTKRSTSHRPSISNPSNFRKVEDAVESPGSFQPLELSIYTPGNELPSLPVFSDEPLDGLAEITFPPRALLRSRSDTLLSRTLSRSSTSFTIPRKPVPSTRKASTDESRYSLYSYRTSIGPSIQSRSQSMYRKAAVALPQTTQDFLDSLDAHLPPPPPPKCISSGSEPQATIHRRASDQNLRLRTHIEERQEMEKRLKDFDAILEERQGSSTSQSPISPLDSDDAAAKKGELEELYSDCSVNAPQPTIARNVSTAASVQAPSAPTTNFKTDPNPTASPPPTNNFIYPPFKQNPTFQPTSPSTRTRISQWLTRSTSPKPTSPTTQVTIPAFYQCQSDLTLTRERPYSLSTTSSDTNTPDLAASPWSTPRSSPHRHRKARSSLSSYQTNVPPSYRGLSFDFEKRPVVTEVGVGVSGGIGEAF